MTDPKEPTGIELVKPAPLAAPMPLATSVELADSFDDQSLEMNAAGDKFRVKGYRRVRRIIGVTEQDITSTSFTAIAGCQVPVPVRENRIFYYFRALVVYTSNDVAEGLAARMAFAGATPYGTNRYRVLLGNDTTGPTKCRFESFGASPVAETSGPGPSAYWWQELEGAFAIEVGDSGTLNIEVATETGGANKCTVRVPTFIDLAIST